MPQNRKKVIEKRRAEVAEYYLKGVPQFKIAERLGVSKSQITRDLKKLSEGWQKSAMDDMSKIKARELAKLDVIEQEAWEAWRRSCEEKTKKAVKKKTYGKKEDTEQSQIKEQMIGDPRWHEIILKCVSKREEILGYGAARKLDIKSDGEKLQGGGAVIILPSNGRELPDPDAEKPQDNPENG